MKSPRPMRLLGYLAATALALSGCTTDTTKTSDPSTAGTGGLPAACTGANPYIAVTLPNLTNPYYVAMKSGFVETGKSLGLNVEVQIANDDNAAQLAQVQSMLQKKPCALALNAVKSEPAAAIVKAANDAGVPVFTVNVIVSADALKQQGATIMQYLGADNSAGGRQVAEQLLKDAGATAALKVGLVTEPDEVPTVLRDNGFKEGIKSDANASVVASVDGNVKPDDSLKATGEMLQGHPDINIIFASTGPAAFGALQAVQSTNKNVKIYGFCAAEQKLTEQYPGCAAQEPYDYGKRVLEQIESYIGGTTPQKEVLRPLKLFTTGQTPAAGEVG